MKKLCLLMLSCIALEAGTVRLLNDSVFVLEAEIKAADGSSLGTITLNPQQAMTWDDYTGGVATYNQSRTPYTVLWYCPAGETFGVTSNLSSGSTTSALASTGNRACNIDRTKGQNSNKNGQSTNSGQPQESQGDIILEQQEQKELQDVGPPEGFFN